MTATLPEKQQRRREPPRFTMADRLKKARESAGLEQAELAKLIGVTRMTVSNYETRRTRPSSKNVERWAEVTGVPVTWIESGRRRGASYYDD